MEVEVCCQNILAEKVEALVCSVNSHLDLGGGAARAIASAAGVQMAQACKDFVVANTGLDVTKVTHVPSGNLPPPVKYIILAVGPPPGMFQNDHDFHQALVETFYNCLHYANTSLKIASVAIPAISSGKTSADVVIFLSFI